MIPDPRQQISCDKSYEALKKHGNTIFVGPTGSGKTLVFCKVIGRFISEDEINRTLVIAHTDEITVQNIGSFQRVYPEGNITLFNAKRKEWNCNPITSFNCNANEKDKAVTTFGMVQTVARHTRSIPKIDLLAIDECHHAPATSYQKIIKAVKKRNPNVMVFGVTATPMRSDKKGLYNTFNNVSDQVSVAELILSGRLVPPVTYIKDIGVKDQLRATQKANGEFDQEAVCDVMNLEPLNETIVKHWQKLGKGRQTVAFCSTVQHAKDMAKAFNNAGERADVVWGNMDNDHRAKVLKDYEDKKINILTNVGVLIEGWDSPHTSCILLLRPCSSKTTMVQMIGRGLRPLETGSKIDCVVADFGITTELHGTLEQDVILERGRKTKSLDHKVCPECAEKLSKSSNMCKRCGYKFTVTRDPAKKKKQETELKNKLRFFSMVEIDLLSQSRFSWYDLTKNKTGSHIIACGLDSWAAVFTTLKGKEKTYHAIGGKTIKPKNEEDKAKHVIEYLLSSSRKVCLARANRYLYTNEDSLAASKSRDWLAASASVGQIRLLQRMKIPTTGLNRYEAACWISFKKNKNKILKLLKENSQF